MKKISLDKIRNIILSVLIAAAFILVVPLHKRLTNYAQSSTIGLKIQLEETIGLHISYKKLSPSILSNIFIKGISVKNLQDETILEIDKTKISFRLIKLLSKDFQKGISNITVDGINVDVGELVDFIKFVAPQGSNEEEEKKGLTFNSITSLVPENSKLKNISMSYQDDKMLANLFFKEIEIGNKARRNSLNIELFSNASVKLLDSAKSFKCNLSASGSIFENLDNSSLSLKILDFTDGNFHLNKISLFTSYLNREIEAHTIQSSNPVSISALYNFDNNLASVRLRTEHLNPLNLISSAEHLKQLQSFKGTVIDIDTSLIANLKKSSVNYSSVGNVYLPDAIFPKGVNVQFALDGNQKQIELNRFIVNGENCIANAELALNFKTLQTNGFIELPYFVLPSSGKIVSTEIYIDELANGFMLFSPQVFLGDKALTALQLSLMAYKDSYDFTFEASDYSHFEAGEPGVIKIDGSYLIKSKYLQASASLISFFVDSLLDFGIEAVDEKISQGLTKAKGFLSPFMVSADAYFSSNFKGFSFNVPYVLLANTKGKNQILMVSANGNNDSVQVNQMSLIYEDFAANANAALDINPETKDMFYTIDLTAETIPYHFSGSIMKEVITVSGDYAADGLLRIGANKQFDGHLSFDNLPIPVKNHSLVFSFNSLFGYDVDNGPFVSLNKFSLEDLSTNFSVSPKINAVGTINKYGAQLTSISYTDFFSSLIGSADVTLNINNSIFDSAGFILNLRNPLSDESVILDASVSNPDGVLLNPDTIMNSLYLNTQVLINDFSLNRIAPASNAANLLTASLFATGTFEHPFISLNVDQAAILMGSNFLKITGGATLEERDLAISDFKVSIGNLCFNDIQAAIDLNVMDGYAMCNLEANMKDKNFILPLRLDISDGVSNKESFLPASFVVKAVSKNIGGTLIKKPFDIDLTLLYSDKIFTVFSSENVGLTGTIGLDGTINGVMANKNGNLDIICRFDKENSLVHLKNLNLNLAGLCSNLNLDDTVIIKAGQLVGDFAIKGRLDDPDFDGVVRVLNPLVRVPFLFDKDLSTSQMVIRGQSNEIHLYDNIYKLNNVDKLQTGMNLTFNKGALNQMNVKLNSYNKEIVPMKIKLKKLNVNGSFMADLSLVMNVDERNTEITGKIFGENVDVYSNISAFTSNNDEGSEEPFNLITDLDCTLGTHAALTFDPVLRAVFVPNTKVRVLIDSYNNYYNIDGQFNLRSGDIAYLNRNFYIKSGSIKFNPTELANPQITFNAETRERDEKGQNVKIILTAENQNLSNLNPKLSSVPAKSENELRTLLGQIVTADSESASNFLFAAGDYAVQSLLLRQTENKLRDLLNFDIFSVRTNVLQNALNIGLGNNNLDQSYSIGNLFDNSTVYIGKYLGSSLYFDAMLQLSFENSVIHNMAATGSLVLQPEFGLELESPFGNIRWNIAPDIEALKNNQYVPSTSVSLMWKLSF